MTHIVIVGGGVIGLMTARELAREGATAITVLERGEIGRESSWAGGGILAPTPIWNVPTAILNLTRYSQATYPALCAELHTATGIDPEWSVSGLLFIPPLDDTFGLGADTALLPALQILPDAAAVAAVEPALAPCTTARLLPGIAQVRNPRLIHALRLDCLRYGVQLLEHQPVLEIHYRDQTVHAVRTPNTTVTGERFLIAAGAWSGLLTELVGNPLPVEPVKGQMLLYRAVPELLRHIVVSGEFYLIPRRDGHILVGSTLERVGFDTTPTTTVRESLSSFAGRTVPAVSALQPTRQWAGLRPGSPHGIPYIGQHPTLKNLYVNAGHFRNGLVMAPAAARLAAELLLGKHPTFDPAPYAVPH